MNNSRIDFQKVRKNYGRKKALEIHDLTVDKPGLTGVIGPNGSGKTTLLKLCAGLIKPTGGNVLLNGKQIRRDAGKSVGFLSEDESLYEFMTPQSTIRFCGNVIPGFNQVKAKEMINELHLEPEQKIAGMSKGNRARLKFIVALSRECPVLCMDEPLSGLDPFVRQDILKLLVSYIDLTNQSVILSTHEVDTIEPFLDRVIFLKDGACVLHADVEELRMKQGQSVIEAMREAVK